ncbi:hypothetical protein F4604DRAFT_1687631 [Suillus subluteus]|nr:hypothetical protein F4604DRAFT_1687631 [Suillus subluteus]
MPYTPFMDSHAEVSDFLSSHSGNFRFSTSIEDDALTLSFQPTYPFPPHIPPPFFTISEPPTPPYSPLHWDHSQTGREEPIVSLAPQSIPIHADSVLTGDGTDTINDGQLPTVLEEGEESEDNFNATLNTTFGYSINDSTNTNNETPEGPFIEPGEEQVLSSPLMDLSNLPAITNNDTPSQAPSSGQDRVTNDNTSIDVFFTGPIVNPDGPQIPDQLISNDWDVNLYRDDTYPGHPVIPGYPKLPTGGPCSVRNWSERVQELYDHRSHTLHLLKLVDTILSPRMLTEATSMSPILSCDKLDHIKGSIPTSFFIGKYIDVNPFFTPSECRRLNAYISVACFHGEHEFASRLSDALLMPFPDEDIVGELTTSHTFDTGTFDNIISAAQDLDHVLKVHRSGIIVLKTSPFCSKIIPAVTCQLAYTSWAETKLPLSSLQQKRSLMLQKSAAAPQCIQCNMSCIRENLLCKIDEISKNRMKIQGIRYFKKFHCTAQMIVNLSGHDTISFRLTKRLPCASLYKAVSAVESLEPAGSLDTCDYLDLDAMGED